MRMFRLRNEILDLAKPAASSSCRKIVNSSSRSRSRSALEGRFRILLGRGGRSRGR